MVGLVALLRRSKEDSDGLLANNHLIMKAVLAWMVHVRKAALAHRYDDVI